MLLFLSSLKSEGNSELQNNSQAEGDSEAFKVPLFWAGSESGTESVAKIAETKSMVWESGLASEDSHMEWLTSLQENAFSLKWCSIVQNCTRENAEN